MERILLDQSHITVLRRYLYQLGEMTPEEIDEIFLTSKDYADPRWRSRSGVVHTAPSHRNHIHVRLLCDI